MTRVELINSLQMRIVLGVVSVAVVIGVGVFWMLRAHYEERMAQNVEGYARHLSQTVESAFDAALSVHSMEGIREEISELEQRGGVDRIYLINRQGEVVMSCPEGHGGDTTGVASAGCIVCHEKPAADRSHAAVVSLDGRQMLRVAVPMENKPQCHKCHDSEERMEGMVILDYPLDEVKGSVSAGVVGLTSLLLLGTIGLVVAVGLVMNRLVVRRLGRLSDAARDIGRGDFGLRIDAAGGDEIGRLGGAFNDMAESLQRFTRKIEADRDFLDRLINSIDDEIVVFDRDLRIVAANRAAGQGGSTGGSCDGVCRTRGDSCCHREGNCIISTTFDTGAPQRRICVTKEGGLDRHTEVVTAPVREEDDRVVQVVCFSRDITERRMMETELIRSERLASLGRLAAGVAHQINNPLASIAACAEGLQRRLGSVLGAGESDLGDLPEYLETIRGAAYEGKRIAGQLLNLSRSEEVDIRPVRPNEIVAEVVALLKHGAESEGKELKVDLDAGVPDVPADRSRIAHALSNLIQNGLDAVEAPGTVEVRTRSLRNGVQIVVADEGCGMEEADLERIFEPFYTTKPPGKGTGLGLSISERTIRDHGGTLAVESRLGEGTRFTVFLPGESGAETPALLEIEGAKDG